MPARPEPGRRGGSPHRLAFRLLVGLGAGGLGAAAAALIVAAGAVDRRPGAAHHLVVGGLRFTYPAVNLAAALLLLLAAVGATTLGMAIRAGVRQRAAHRRLLGRLRVVGPVPDHPGVTVIADARPQAFCAGYLRPRVYVSTGALDLLTPSELEAVLLHEDHHRRLRDPLRAACGRILSQALFFLPVLRPLRDVYSDGAELAADASAVRRTGGERAALAGALLAFEASAPQGAVGIAPQRVDSLLGTARPPRLPASLTVLALVTLGSLVVLLWRTSAAARAHTTFNLPVLSAQPCVLLLALLPLLLALAGLAARSRRFLSA